MMSLGLDQPERAPVRWTPIRVGQDLLVGAEVVGHRVGRVDDLLPSGGLQVAGHGVVVGEQRRGGADLGPHVADGGLAGAGDGVGAGTEVLDDGAGAALDGEDLGHLEDDVLGCGPPESSPVRWTPMS